MKIGFEIKQRNSLPRYGAILSKSNGAPIDLTNATSIKLRLVPEVGGVPKVFDNANVVSAVGGVVEYAWATNGVDTDTPGDYLPEWVIAFTGGDTLVVQGKDAIRVSPNYG